MSNNILLTEYKIPLSNNYIFQNCIVSNYELVPMKLDKNTIKLISFNSRNLTSCSMNNLGDTNNLYNVTIVATTAPATLEVVYYNSQYFYTYDNKQKRLLQFDKYSNLEHPIATAPMSLSTKSKIVQYNNSKAIVLKGDNEESASNGEYYQVDLLKMTIQETNTIPNMMGDVRQMFWHNNILYMINTEGTVNRYQYYTRNRPYRPLITTLIVFVTIVCIIGVLVLIILGFIRSMYRRNRKQKEIEMRLLETEVPFDPNAAENEFKKKTIVIPIEELKFGSRLSEGANGVVYKGKWRKINVAIKRIKATDDIDGFIQECAILNHLRHMNVVLFLGISQDNASNRYIVTEFVENSSIDTLIYNDKLQRNQILSFSDKLRILSQVCQGMIYLHSMQPPIIHRDLKPQNILLTKTLDAKICDFGVSKYCESSIMTGIQYGTFEYSCPEILMIEYEDESANYTEKCDVYSFGIIMWELFFMVKPYFPLKKNTKQRVNLLALGQRVVKGTRPEIPFELDDEPEMEKWFNMSHKQHSEFNADTVRKYIEICKDCWSGVPETRPSFDTLYDRISELQFS
jgi:tRNA A-37 threonylcarbamoyl transferase component Bud32/preprotein translocase subunit YajC